MSKKLNIFVMQGCPYCRNASRAVEELQEDSRYAQVELRWIDENKEPAVAEQFDYYYVPTVFLDGEKLYECSPSHDYAAIRENIRQAFETTLAD